MVSPGYLRALGLSVAIWLALFLLFTWTIDPYGVSPLRLSLQGMNAQKPKRIDIDRLIKPYEVWRYQPRTVFLGTSRMHQSMDPAVLDGTSFAPAYNASMPAASMDMRFNNYPTKAMLRRIARSAGADVGFVEAEAFLFRGGGRAAPMLRWLRTVKLDRLAVRIAATVMLQRYMIVKPRPRSGLPQRAQPLSAG